MLALVLGVALPAAAQQPPPVARAAAAAMADCRSAGGTPRLMPAFEATLDLNGDGQPDYVHDFTGLDCQGAASFFCGSAGCPLAVFLSPGYRPNPLGHAQGWTVDRSGALPVMVLALHGSSCGRAGVEACERRLGWNGRELAALGAGRAAAPGAAPPAVAPPSAPPVAVRPPAPPSASGGTKGGEPAAARFGAWEVRTGQDGRPIAIAAGPGVVRAVTLLCHESVPVLAVALRARPPAGPVSFGLAGRGGRAEVPLAPGAGGLWYGACGAPAWPACSPALIRRWRCW